MLRRCRFFKLSITMEVDTISSTTTKKFDKIARVLQKFLEPNFKVKNDVYLNLFLTHMVGKNGEAKKDIDREYKEQFVEWLVEASSLWDKKKVVPPKVILSFTLNLASILSKEEQVFIRLNIQNTYECLVGLSQTNLNNDASITLGLITLLCSFLEHKSGIQWILATTYWTDVINLGREAHTMYIRKKAYEFVAKLLEKTVPFNRQFCYSMVALLIQPLQEVCTSLTTFKSMHEIENQALFDRLRPSLIFISEVLEILVKGTANEVQNIFMELKTSDLAKELLLLSQIEDFSYELIKIRCILVISKLVRESATRQDSTKCPSYDSITIFDVRAMFNSIQDEMDKNHVKCIIKISHYAHMLSCSITGKLPLCIRKGHPIEFQNQMVLFQIMPIMILLCMDRGIRREMMLNDLFMTGFIQKCVKMSAIRTVELCFRWKQRLMNKPDLIEDTIFGLQYMLKTKTFLNKERAAIFFQPLVYALKDTLIILEQEGHIDMGPNYPTFLYTLIEAIIDIVQTFDLTWKDSIETISVMSIACKFLHYTHWEQKLVVSGLRLLNLALSKYMSPDMVLLMDNSKDSSVSQTGSLLYAKCHDGSWEVRDTALENVYTLSLNAKSNFPSYTNVLLDASLPQLVVQMALKDGEYYVRATAFRCLHQLIQIPEVWEIFMATDKFLDSILNVFENETEGVVRKEVATLIFKISKFQSFPNDMLPRVYNVMTHAAIGDLHWEVKFKALDFWFDRVVECLRDQGMLDCDFPAVTFSKELRKIVTLNETEIRRRLIKVLNHLSHIGCLYVLKCACLDDCDLEVSRKAVETCLKHSKMLKKYKVSCNNIDDDKSASLTAQGLTTSVNGPPSAASSSTLTVKSPDLVSLGSPEISNILLDPFSPFSNLDSLLTSDPDSYLTSLSPLTSRANSDSSEQKHSPSPTTPLTSSSQSQRCPLIEDTTLEHVEKGDCGSDMGYASSNGLGETDHMEAVQATTSFNPVTADSVLDELLNSNDMSFLQKICNPADQVKNTTTAMKKATYLAPSEYVKFLYNEAESRTIEKTRWLDQLDEFDSLLDDILSEYNVVPDINNMDCY